MESLALAGSDMAARTEDSDAAYFAAFDRARAVVLRRRLRWYAFGALGLIALSLLGTCFDVVNGVGRPWFDLLYDGSLALPFVLILVWLKRRSADRETLVRAVTTLTIVVSCIAMFYEAHPLARDEGETEWGAMKWGAIYSALTFPMFFSLACVLIPMTAAELRRIALPCVAFFPLVLWFNVGAPRGLAIWSILLQVAACAPAFAWSLWRYREFDARFRAERLREKYQSLSGDVKEISAELTQARRLHEALFPPPIVGGAVHVSYRYEPMREIGGDFLYIHRNTMAGRESVTVALIDVSGHGIPAALAVNRLHGELQRSCALRPDVSPAQLLSDLNTYSLVALSPQGVFATAVVIRVDAASGVVRWANAGHPTAFLREASGEMRAIPSTTTMLGIVESELFEPEQQEAPFNVGDTLIAYTDGANEARSSGGEDFSIRRIRDLVRGADVPEAGSSKASDRLAKSIYENVIKHRAGRAMDDMLIVEVRFAQAASGEIGGGGGPDPMTTSWRSTVGLSPSGR